jgi:ribosomal protein L44E
MEKPTTDTRETAIVWCADCRQLTDHEVTARKPTKKRPWRKSYDCVECKKAGREPS